MCIFRTVKATVRLADVARAARVSQGTASNVFNRPELVRLEVRERVEATARRLGYVGPDPKGRLLRAGKVNAIGVAIADDMPTFFGDPFTRLLMAGIAEVCDQHGAGIALISSATGDEHAAWSINTALVDGFIVHCKVKDGDRLIELARRRNLPFVAVDHDAGRGTSSVLIDNEAGAHAAMRHVLELGHRHIGVLTLHGHDGPVGRVEGGRVQAHRHRTEHERLRGFARALAERGIDLERLPVFRSANDPGAAQQHAGDLLEAAPATTAIVAMSDVLAGGAIAAARARGLRVPQDLSVIGFDDIPDAATSEPPLTTIAQPIEEKGRRAAQLIFEPGAPGRVVLDVQLVQRGSTARPRRR
jgi:DNA-binding LacI/PurR family transcriptional regulator